MKLVQLPFFKESNFKTNFVLSLFVKLYGIFSELPFLIVPYTGAFAFCRSSSSKQDSRINHVFRILYRDVDAKFDALEVGIVRAEPKLPGESLYSLNKCRIGKQTTIIPFVIKTMKATIDLYNLSTAFF